MGTRSRRKSRRLRKTPRTEQDRGIAMRARRIKTQQWLRGTRLGIVDRENERTCQFPVRSFLLLSSS